MRSAYAIHALALGAALIAGVSLPSVSVLVGPAYAQGRADMPSPLSAATIRSLQQALNNQGIKVAIDGVMGAATREAIRTYQSQHHLPVTGMPDQATLDKLRVTAERRAPGEQPPRQPAQRQMGPGQRGPGPMGQGQMGQDQIGMMSPQMMEMMHQMMAGQGAMMGSAGQGARMGGMAASDPMGRANAMGTMASLIHGGPSGEMTVERVTKIVNGLLAWHGNPRLKLGAVGEEGGEITAEILTQDGSLVQKLAFNRHPGVVRSVP